MIDTVLVFEGQGARVVPGDPEIELATLRPSDAQTAIVRHQVQRAEAYRKAEDFAVIGQSLGEISALVVAGASASTTARRRPAAGRAPRAARAPDLDDGVATRIKRNDAEVAQRTSPLAHQRERSRRLRGVGDASSRPHFPSAWTWSPATFRDCRVVALPHALLQPVAEAMAAALAEIELKAPAVPVISPTGPRPVVDVADVQAVIVEALVSPVAWSTALTSAAEQWPDARWRECGPSGSLYRFVWKNGLKLDWAEA